MLPNMPRTIYPASPELRHRRRQSRRRIPDESDPNMPVLSVRMVADRLSVHPHMVRGWIHSGKLRAYDFGSRAAGYRITPNDFRKFLDGIKSTDDEDDGMF